MQQSRVYPLSFASAATSTGTVEVGNASRLYLYHSGTTAFNAGTGNISFFLRGSITSSATAFRILSATIATDISGGCYNWPVNVNGFPYVKVEFGTAVTGSASNTVYLIASDEF